MWAFIVINFSLDTALNVSHGFWLVRCVLVPVGFEEHFYFCLRFIVYPFVIQEQVVQLPSDYVVLSAFLILSSNLIALWSERLFVMISVVLHLLSRALLPIMWSILE